MCKSILVWTYGVDNEEKIVKINVKIEAVLRLHTPPLRDHCMSSCKYKIVSLHHVTASVLILLPRHLASSSLSSLGLLLPLASSSGVYISGLWYVCLDVYSSFSALCSSLTTILDVGEYYHLWYFQIDYVSSELHVLAWYAYLVSLVQNFLVSEYSQLEVLVDYKVVLQNLMSFLHLFSLNTQYNNIFPIAHD